MEDQQLTTKNLMNGSGRMGVRVPLVFIPFLPNKMVGIDIIIKTDQIFIMYIHTSRENDDHHI